MQMKSLVVYLLKLAACGIAFVVGMMVGSMVATAVGLPSPAMPQGMDANTALVFMVLTAPILALALALLGRGLGGGLATRALALSFLLWITYTVNTVIEASIFTTYEAASLFTVVAFLVADVCCGCAVALLFAPADRRTGFVAACRAFFGRRSATSWAWRLAVASIGFVAVYLVFGNLVFPVTEGYFRQQMFGLAAPTLSQMLAVLSVRSVLFLLAILPVLIVWRRSRRSLILSLGFALFVFVGFVYMLQAVWMPAVVRVAHGLEILADSFVYAWVLGMLLVPKDGEAA